MSRSIGWIIAGVLAVAPVACADAMTKQERKQLIQELKKSEKMVKSATKGLSHEQWTFKPAPDRWSVQDCLEHLTLAEEAGLKFNEVILKSPPTKAKGSDETAFKASVDRSTKIKTGAPMNPTGRWKDPSELLKEFVARRKKTIEYVKTTQDDLRGHSFQGVDAYQGFLTGSGHTERHVAQMLEVKADSNFPKR